MIVFSRFFMRILTAHGQRPGVTANEALLVYSRASTQQSTVHGPGRVYSRASMILFLFIRSPVDLLHNTVQALLDGLVNGPLRGVSGDDEAITGTICVSDLSIKKGEDLRRVHLVGQNRVSGSPRPPGQSSALGP